MIFLYKYSHLDHFIVIQKHVGLYCSYYQTYYYRFFAFALPAAFPAVFPAALLVLDRARLTGGTVRTRMMSISSAFSVLRLVVTL